MRRAAWLAPCLESAAMSAFPDICIRGAGITGRVLALLLAREKLRVALVAPPASASQKPGQKPDVRAYAINPAGQKLLAGLRCWPAPEHSQIGRASCRERV